MPKQEQDPILIAAEKVRKVVDLSERATGFGPEEMRRAHNVIEHRLYNLSKLSAQLLVEAYVGSRDDERETEVESVLTRVILAADIIAGVEQPEKSSVDPGYVGHLASQVAPVFDITGEKEREWSERVEVEVTRPAVFAEIEAAASPQREQLLIAA